MLVDVFEILVMKPEDDNDIVELDPDETPKLDSDEILKLDAEEIEMTDEVVMGTGSLELELLRELREVELIEVLDMGYFALLELIWLLDLEVGLIWLLDTRMGPALVLSAPAELLAPRLVGNLELLGVRCSTRLEEIVELDEDLRSVDEDLRSVDDAEPDDDTTFVDELSPAGADGL